MDISVKLLEGHAPILTFIDHLEFAPVDPEQRHEVAVRNPTFAGPIDATELRFDPLFGVGLGHAGRRLRAIGQLRRAGPLDERETSSRRERKEEEGERGNACRARIHIEVRRIVSAAKGAVAAPTEVRR